MTQRLGQRLHNANPELLVGLPLWPLRKWKATWGSFCRPALKKLWISPRHCRVWEDFLWLVHFLEVTVSSKGFWHAKPVWKNILHLFRRGAVFMGGSLCSVFEDFNRSRGLRELRRGSFFSGHFHKCIGTMSILIHVSVILFTSQAFLVPWTCFGLICPALSLKRKISP